MSERHTRGGEHSETGWFGRYRCDPLTRPRHLDTWRLVPYRWRPGDTERAAVIETQLAAARARAERRVR